MTTTASQLPAGTPARTDAWRPPKDRAANLAWREGVIAMAHEDLEFRAAVLAECAENLEFFFDGFLWTEDPREPPGQRVVPFILWDYQADGLRTIDAHITSGQDLLHEKSRDMGATWGQLGVVLRRWLFDREFSGLLGSRKEDLVDNRDDRNSHFERLRFMLRLLPAWMMPAGFDWNVNDKYLLLTNPANGSQISGESANPDFGRQGRTTVALYDEFAFWPYDEASWRSAADTTRCRIVTSTPNGRFSKFARLRFGDDGEKIEVLTWHWSSHPEKRAGLYTVSGKRVKVLDATFDVPADYAYVTDGPEGALRSVWYDHEARRRSAPDLAQEVDISYDIVGMPVFDVPTLRGLDESARRTRLVFAGEIVIEAADAARRVATAAARLVGDVSSVFRQGQAGVPMDQWPSYVEIEDPEEGGIAWHRFVMGIDPASGTGNDDAAVVVVDANTGQQVAEYVNSRAEPVALSEIAAAIGRRWHNAYALYEGDARGMVIGRSLHEAGYEGGYYVKPGGRTSGVPGAEDFGWPTTSGAKELRLREHGGELKRGEFVPRTRRAIGQYMSFAYDKKGRLGEEGVRDDLVRAGALAAAGAREVGPARSPAPIFKVNPEFSGLGYQGGFDRGLDGEDEQDATG